MDRITTGFGPISDVTGFSHKGGMTFLEIQEKLRAGHNDLVAAFNNLVSHVEGRNAEIIERINVPVDQYNAMVETLTGLATELEQYSGFGVRLDNLTNSIADYINSYPFITPTDNPTIPPEGRAMTYLVSPSVTWPPGLLWSNDPDMSSAPRLSGNAMVTMFTAGGITYAIVGALFPRSKRPDTLYSITVRADRPVAYWRLDETSGNRALDDTENFDGTYGGNPTLGAVSLLRNNGGTAVSYPDRTNNANKVAVSHAPQLNAFGAFTIEMWVKLTDVNSDATQQLLDKTSMASANGQYGIMYDNRSSQGSPKRLRVQIAGAQLDWLNADTFLAAGGHLVVTVSGAGTGQAITMYWNGAIVASNTSATVNWSSANELPLNMCARGGVTDEISLYHNALTAAQVAVHYAAR